MNKSKTLLAGLVLSTGLAVTSAPQTEASGVIGAGKHCVAWKTNKTLGLVKRVSPVGMNCNVTVKAVKKGKNYSAEVYVPIRSFQSGEKDRDKAVLDILKAKVNPNVVFKVDPLPLSSWQKMLKNGSGPVRGKLYIGNQAKPLSTTAKVRKRGKNIEVYGVVRTKFTTLGIKPPTVGPGGSIAKVDDYLELHFNLLSNKVQNAGIVPGL